jgi:hypothetical protein
MKDLASFSISSLRQVPLRLGLEFVQALPGAEMQHTAFVVLCVALPRLYRHPAHRIFPRTFLATMPGVSFMPFVAVTTMTAVHHVRATAEAHHQIEERREK